ncbi:hypothetical protein SAMN02745136_05031 [Anaerocolumna jejuensis DSM 15929]|uniref:MazG nucleotide pyrophosphohydrolase domain-containing protein n=1 Tax=Anaerocolumna jejuensis DSM 15929 TaxID=1121322 RepID=A0A1M7B519_9FIRM|nr:hypothetical protein [Anaerocolumna jejuensis]SHL50080.1 hypothetical protein SAMN02745136_05031 [Anaerocolumna jejuensis DSM 15929]
MDDIKECILEAINRIENTCTLLYQNKLEEGNAGICKTIDGIITVVDAVNSYNRDGNRVQYDLLELNRCLVETEKALKVGDFVLYSDILYYDIRSIFLELLKI